MIRQEIGWGILAGQPGRDWLEKFWLDVARPANFPISPGKQRRIENESYPGYIAYPVIFSRSLRDAAFSPNLGPLIIPPNNEIEDKLRTKFHGLAINASCK